jgi:hypothetical protein
MFFFFNIYIHIIIINKTLYKIYKKNYSFPQIIILIPWHYGPPRDFMLVRHWLYQTNDKINGEALTRELRYRLALGKMYGFQRHWNIRHTNQNHYTTINQSSFFLLLISLQNKTPILNKMPLKYFFIFFLAPPPPLPSTVRPVAPFQILLLLIYYQVQTPLLTCHLICPNISGIYHYPIVYYLRDKI